MTIDEIQNLINERLTLIEINAKGLTEAKERAAIFLVTQSILATFLKDFESEKSKVKTVLSAIYAQELKSLKGGITEKKIELESIGAYSNMREAYENLDAIRDYIKTHMKIFENAHLMFRQYSRD